MAFCAVSERNVKDITSLVFSTIRKDPAALKNFKDFSQGIMNKLVGMKVPTEKALALTSYLPQIISDFIGDKTDRDLLRKAGVSLDAITSVEEIFDDYKKLAGYIGIKNETSPIVVVNDFQLAQDAKLAKHIADTKVTFEGEVRFINGKKYETRVTSIAKAGFEDKRDTEELNKSLALKHGNTVDAIVKEIFDDKEPKQADYADRIEPAGFDGLVAKIKAVKSALQQQGFVFRTAVTLYDPKTGVSGEADLIALSPEGKGYVIDFKTAAQRFNESYLKNETLTYRSDNVEVGILSKWKQYGTQGYLYGQLMKEQIGIQPVEKTGIIGINIGYDRMAAYDEAKIQKIVDVEIHDIPYTDVRKEYKGKTVAQMVKEYESLKTQELGSVNELKPRKIFKSGRLPRQLDRIAKIDEIAATNDQLRQEIEWLKNNPIGKGLLINMSNMINTGLFGKWTLDAITLFKNASQGTGYHEGWHRFSQVFMTKEQKDRLYDSVRKDKIDFTTRDGRKLNTATAPAIDIEELLAEEFAKYGLNPTEYKWPKSTESRSLVSQLFKAIWDFLQRYFGNNPQPIELFQRLYTGKIADYVPSVNNAYWGSLNSLAQTKEGKEIVSNERFPLYVRSMDYLVGKALRDANKSFTAFKQSKRLQSMVLDNVFLVLEAIQNDPARTDQQAEELYNILENDQAFIKAYLTATSFETLKDFTIDEEVFSMTTEELAAMEDIREQYEEPDDANEEEDDSKPERFDRAGNEDSAFSVADDAIQDFFRTIPKIKSINPDGTFEYDLNELGLPENHKFYDVFYKTKKMLSGAFKLEEMMSIMQNKSNQALFPELSIVNGFMEKFMKPSDEEKNFNRKVQNVQFAQAFFHVMVMPDVSNMQLTLNFLPLTKNYRTFRPTMVSYRTASRNLSLKIIKTWEKNFKDRRNKTFTDFKTWEQDRVNAVTTPLYLTEDGKILLNPFVDYNKKYPNTLTGIADFWNVMGVTINPKVFTDKKSVQELLDAKNDLISNITTYRKSIELPFVTSASMTFSDLGIVGKAKDVNSLFSSMPSYLMDVYAKTLFIGNPVTFFNDKQTFDIQYEKDGKIIADNQDTVAMRFVFEDLAAIEEKFGDRVSSGSFRIEDKTKYPYYIPNQLLITTELLNRLENTTQFGDNLYLQNLDPIKNSWMNRSYFMKQLFDHNGERVKTSKGAPIKILIEDIASIRFITDTGVLEKAPRSLTRDEKFVMDVLTLFKAGAIEIPRAETSSTTFSIRLSDYGKGKVVPIDLKESISRGDELPETFHSIVKDYFMAEIEKRQWFVLNDSEVRGANKIPLADQFNIFEGILPKELKDQVVDNLDKTPEEIFAMKGIEEQFRKAIVDYFKGQVAELHPRFEKELNKDQQKMIQDTLQAKDIGMYSAARMFALNHFILSQEFYNLYYGDLYFYKNAFKRGKYVTNTGNSFFIDDMRNELLNSVQHSTMHSIMTGKKLGGKDFRFLNTSIIEDVEMKSVYVNDDDSKNLLLQGILDVRLASGSLIPNSPEYARFVENTKKALEKYDAINIADGQGIVGLDFYRNFSIMTNIWSEEKEMEYNRQKAIFRNHFNHYFKLDSEGNRINLEGDELAQAIDEDKKLREHKPFAFFNPLKISYTGPQAKNGPTRPVFDKFSVRPMIPEMAIGRRDEDLMNKMAEQDIDYVKFRSGSKVYQDTSFNWYKKVADGEYDLNDFNAEEIKPNQLFAGFLKHQLSTEGYKEENIFGSQFRKIVFGVKYTENVRNNPTLLTKLTNLEKQYKGLVDDLINVEETDLFSLLGVKPQNGNYHVSDMKKFLNLLQTESLKRGVAINNVDYIQYNEATKNAKYPIDYAFNRQQIQDLLSGLLDNRLRRLKTNGSSFIQVSSAGTENRGRFTNPTEEDIRKYGTNGLHYYQVTYDQNGKPLTTTKMGAKVALKGEFKNLLNLPAPASFGESDSTIQAHGNMLQKAGAAAGKVTYNAGKIKLPGMSEEEALKRLNLALQDPIWRAKYAAELTLVGYRIPTQNNNFIDHMEIMEFLPEAAGSIIILPPEHIIKSGSDFDIDKMNIMRPSLGRNGRLVRRTSSKVIENGIEVSKEDSFNMISEKISEQVYTEFELKKELKRLNDIQAGLDTDISNLELVQKKVRLSMLDLAIKAGVDDSLIDNIMERMLTRQRSILPEQRKKEGILPLSEGPSISDEEAFTDEEIVQAAVELEGVTADFLHIDAQLQRLRERYNNANSDKGKIEEKDLKWFNKKRAYKKAKNNDLISTLSELMSVPEYFELFVTPSSASILENATNELIASQANMTSEEYAKALKDTDGKLYDRSLTPQQTSTYKATSDAFENLLSKRKDLGGYAIQRTFADIFNFVGLTIAKQYSVEISKNKFETKVLHLPLIPPADRATKVVNGRIIMYGDSVTGIPIARSFDELISLTVDLAGSPAYPHMGINAYNKKHLQYLIHQGTDPKVAIWFLNQPVLKDLFKRYEDQRRKISGYTLKHAIVEQALAMRILENPTIYDVKKKYEVLALEEVKAKYEYGDLVEEGYWKSVPNKANQFLSRPWYDLHTQNLADSDYFSFDEMDASIRSQFSQEVQKVLDDYFGTEGKTESDLWRKKNTLDEGDPERDRIETIQDKIDEIKGVEKKKQGKILAYFASITEESDNLMRLQFAENVDTTTYATLTSLIRNENNRRQVRKSGLFDNKQIDRLEKESMIAPFDYTKKAKSILKTLFPKLYTTETIKAFSALVNDVFAKNTQIERISKIVENDFIEFVYKNYGTYKGENLTHYFQKELINTDSAQNHPYFSYRLNSIKAQYPELLDIPFVAGLYEDVYFPPDEKIEKCYKGLDNKEIHNIFFLRNPDNPTFEKNVYTNNWRNLIDFDPERLGLKEQYTEDDIKKISEFFHDLVYFSLYQAGLTNTGNGFSDLIPYEHWAGFVEQAFKSYDDAKERNPNLEEDMLQEFQYRFRQMNPKVNWRTKSRLLDSYNPKTGRNDTMDIEFYRNYYRGKDYFVTSEELLRVKELYLRTDEDLEDANEAEVVPEFKDNNTFIPGVYVEYEGVNYILIKQLAPQVWQLYDPLKTGTNAKVAVREAKLTALADKASIVQYGQKNYIVTSSGTIIDIDTSKAAYFPTNDINRKNILELADQQKTVSLSFKGYRQAKDPVRIMRETASSFVVEMVGTEQSPAIDTLKTGSVLEQKGTKEQHVGRSTKNLADPGEILMVARDARLADKPLLEDTKAMIKFYKNDFDMNFIVGDNPQDVALIDYLRQIEAPFTIYHSGSPKINLTPPPDSIGPTDQPPIEPECEDPF